VSTVEHEGGGRRSAGGRIVVGVDGSASSRAALRWGLRQAATTGASIEVVAAWGFPVYIGDADFWPVDVDQEEIVAHQLRRVLDEIVPSGSTVPLSAVVTRGPPAVALLERSVGADLLVIGTRGHSEFTEMLLGSVSLHCVARAACPVVVVHAGHA
jgi:nucleotide-binding universal stress UspA family protein